MSLTGKAKLAGVIGWPVAHSLSPRLHGYWIDKYGLDAAYVPLAVRPEDFARVVDGLRRAGFRGVNVTVPHKQAAFALAARADFAAEITGAANLLLFGEDGIAACNTDAAGLAASLSESLGARALQGKTAAIWGAGGAARAAVLALSDLGMAQIRLFSRELSRAGAIVTALTGNVSADFSVHGFEDWEKESAGLALLVNATSAGMGRTPSIDLSLDGLPESATVFDAVYNPLETGLLKRAKARGLRPIDGLGMLMHQAVPAFEAFFEVRPQIDAGLRRDLEEALHGG
jgi:shikimate dehydrogenase